MAKSAQREGVRVASGRVVVRGAIVSRARFPEGARGRILVEDDREPVDLDPDEEAGMLKGLQEIAEGRGRPVARLLKKLRRTARSSSTRRWQRARSTPL